MSEKISILLFGPTGYIGGAVLARLLDHSNVKNFDITLYLRNAERAKLFEQKYDVKAVVGTNEEVEKITPLVEQAHVVFQLADSWNVPLTNAILSGMQRRHTKLGDVPIFIHSGGVGILCDDARGEYAAETICNDLDVEQIKSIPRVAVHGEVNVPLMEADAVGYVRTYLVAPSCVYGIADHALVKAGISNAQSFPLLTFMKMAVARKRSGIIGKGKAYWPHVHIEDCAEIYITLFDSILADPDKIGHGWEGLYFVENGEFSWYQMGKAIGDALVALGIASEAEPTSLSVEDIKKHLNIPGSRFDAETFGWFFGTNARCRAERARSIGWKPKYTTEDLLNSLKPEIESIL